MRPRKSIRWCIQLYSKFKMGEWKMKKFYGVLLISALSLGTLNIAYAKTCVMNNTDKVLIVMGDVKGKMCNSYSTIMSNTGKAICYNECGGRLSIYDPRPRHEGKIKFLCSVDPGSTMVVQGYHNDFTCSPGGSVAAY